MTKEELEKHPRWNHGDEIIQEGWIYNLNGSFNFPFFHRCNSVQIKAMNSGDISHCPDCKEKLPKKVEMVIRMWMFRKGIITDV